MRKCEYCGKEFEPKQSRSKYCSRECQVKGFHASRPKGETKKCKWCGKEFFAPHKGIKYCSLLCKMKAADEQRTIIAEQKKQEKKPIKCKHCGAEFVPRHKRQIFCCEQCGYEYRYEHTPKKKSKGIREYNSRICAICGKEFVPSNSIQKYCSKECSRKAQYSKNKKEIVVNSERPKKKTAKISPASQWFAKMSLREISEECARLHISYGKASLMAMNNMLPEDFGKRCK
ncbi:MAG: hypothetical protein E7406_01725 [Ruminococcaceae bacterium]|nr:hypothetical protein [Oscillospiraceae bacterium]